MSVKTLIYPRSSRPDRDAVAGNGRRRRPSTDYGLSAKWSELCRPFRAVISLLGLPGVSRGATPDYSNGIPSGWQSSGPVLRSSSGTEGGLHPHRLRRGGSELLESGCEFVSEGIRGESVMPQDCPEFARGGGGRGSGVKAVPMHRDRSPRPGGIQGGLEHDEHPWGLRRGLDTADSGLVRIRRRSKWGWGFIWQDAGYKSVRARACPEIRSGKAEGSRLNAKVRNDEVCIVLIGGGAVDRVDGHRGILDLNHDLV